MDTDNQVCHDLKTERPDVTQPLPGILAFLPILFALSLLGALALNALFFLKLQNAEKMTAEWNEKTAAVESEKGKLTTDRQAVVVEEKRAKDARRTASPTVRPSDRSVSIRSISTIPLLMMMPARLNSPSIAVKSKYARVTTKPRHAPIKVSGMVSRMISGRRTELNCSTNSARIPKSA